MSLESCDNEARRFGCKFKIEQKKSSDLIKVVMTGPKNYSAAKFIYIDKSMDTAKEALLIEFLMKYDLGHLYGTEKKVAETKLFQNMLSKL